MKNITVYQRIVALLLLSVLLLFAVSCGKKDESTNEKESGTNGKKPPIDAKEYVTIDDSVYLNQKIEAPYPQYVTESDIDEAIENALLENGTNKYVSDRAAVEGDTVNIYYKGVTTDKDGKETAFDGGTYMTFGSPYPLTLGSDQFIDGFEDGLIGVIPQDTFRYVSDDESLTVAADSVIHVTYEATYDDNGTSKTKTGEKVIENLAEPTFGEAFVTALIGAKAGETRTLETKYDINSDKTEDTVSMKVTVEDIAVLNPCEVTATFPDPYQSADLAGKTVKFYVWVESVTEVIPAELNETFIKETMKITVADGEDAIMVFREYVRENLQSQRDENVKDVTLSDAWDNLLEKSVFKSLPEDMVSEARTSVSEELEYYFGYYGAYYGYNSVEEFAPLYFGVSETDFNLEKYLTEYAENSVKSELIAQYLCEKHNITVDEKTLAEEVEKLFQEEADYANAQDPSANYTAESVRQELEAQYGEGYFEEYVESNLKSELLNDFLFSNYTVTFTENTSAK